MNSTVPYSARVWNYWLGEEDNYPVDRESGDAYREIAPHIETMARVSRSFLVRAVSFAAGELGIRQFLDLGTGLPTEDNTPQVAQRAAPTSRIVYVDNDHSSRPAPRLCSEAVPSAPRSTSTRASTHPNGYCKRHKPVASWTMCCAARSSSPRITTAWSCWSPTSSPARCGAPNRAPTRSRRTCTRHRPQTLAPAPALRPAP